MAAACPAWLRAAQDETASSDAFRQLCRELVWRVEHRGDGGAGFGALSPAARDALLEDVYGQMVVDGGSAGQFEALLSAQLDLSLSRAVTAARLEGEQRGGGSASVVELIEAEASAGILALLAVPNSNLQLDFNLSVRDSFDVTFSAVLRELDESNRFVQKSAESISI